MAADTLVLDERPEQLLIILVLIVIVVIVVYSTS